MTDRINTKKGRWGNYTLKENPMRFFLPNEWKLFINNTNPKNRFFYEFLFQTGMRYNEAKNIQIKNFDFKNRIVIILKPKGGRKNLRYVNYTKQFKDKIKSFIDLHELKGDDYLGFTTIQGLIKNIKSVCKRSGIKDYDNFSVHTIRKTHENYLLTLNKPIERITQHIGHNINTAREHYISGLLIKEKNDIEKINEWLGGMFE
jgi:integrase